MSGPRAGWRSTVPHGNGRHPELIRPGLRNHFVYVLKSRAGAVLYVGCTRRPEARWAQHRAQRPDMVALVASARMLGPYDYPTARRIERETQIRLSPIFGRRLAMSAVPA